MASPTVFETHVVLRNLSIILPDGRIEDSDLPEVFTVRGDTLLFEAPYLQETLTIPWNRHPGEWMIQNPQISEEVGDGDMGTIGVIIQSDGKETTLSLSGDRITHRDITLNQEGEVLVIGSWAGSE